MLDPSVPFVRLSQVLRFRSEVDLYTATQWTRDKRSAKHWANFKSELPSVREKKKEAGAAHRFTGMTTMYPINHSIPIADWIVPC